MEKTYVIVRNVKEGNRLLRRENKKNPEHVTANVGCYHLVDFAKDIILQMRAAQGELSALVLLDKLSCAAVLDTIFKENDTVDWFVPKACQGISTAAEVLESLNMLRMGKCTEQWETYRQEACEGISRDREHQLFLLIFMLEKRLKEQDAYDEALLFLEAVRGVKEQKKRIRLPMGRFFISGDCRELLTAVEREFLELLTGGSYEVFEQHPVTKETLCGNVTFFKGYGMANEAEYVVRKIIEEKQPLGEVSVLYTSPEYEPYLRGVFGSRGLPYRLVSSYSAVENSYVAVMLATLEFVENGYVYEDLKRIIRMPRLWAVYEEQEKKKYTGLAYAYYKSIREGIAWGRERYVEYVARRRQEECTPAMAEFLVFLEKLTELFQTSDSKTPYADVFWKLVDFAKKYVQAPLEWRNILGVFKQEAKVLERLPMPKDEEELLAVLKQRIQGLTIDEEEKQDAVAVCLIGDGTIVLERKFVYILGLSAEAFGCQQAESAVLSDKERCTALDAEAGFVDLRGERELRRSAYLKKTLQTHKEHGAEGGLYLGYSGFDVVNLREQTPAVIVLRLLEMAGKTMDDVIYSGYEDAIRKSVIMKEADVWRQPEKKESEVVEENAAEGRALGKDVSWTVRESQRFSATALQTLLSCPLQFYYQRVKQLPKEDYAKRLPEQWLGAADRGTLAHEILERYCNAKLKGKMPCQVEGSLDEEVFQVCVAEAVAAMIKKCPYDSEAVRTLEKEQVAEKCRQYLVALQAELSAPGNPWMVLECEVAFDNVSLYYNEKGPCNPSDEGAVELGLFGYMDRVDGYVENGTLYLRILDYKSGSMKNLEKGIATQEKQQHVVYALAAKHMGARLYEKWNLPEVSKVVVKEVSFLHFFEEGLENQVYTLDGPSIEQFSDKVQKVFVEVLGKQHYTVLEKLDCNKNSTNSKDKALRKTEAACKYCTYKDICREEKFMGGKW